MGWPNPRVGPAKKKDLLALPKSAVSTGSCTTTCSNVGPPWRGPATPATPGVLVLRNSAVLQVRQELQIHPFGISDHGRRIMNKVTFDLSFASCMISNIPDGAKKEVYVSYH